MSCARGCCPDQASHYRSVSIASDNPGRVAERKDAADMAAYRRLRKNGVQPAGIEGSSQLEREAKTTVEIERGMLIRNDRLRNQVAAAHDAVRTVPDGAA